MAERRDENAAFAAGLSPDPIKLARLDYPDMVQVTCWDGKKAALGEWAQTCLGPDLPPPGQSATATDGDTRILSAGPDRWLVLRDGAEALIDGFPPGVGTVLDLGSARTLFRFSGKNIGRLLNKGCAIDFSDEVTPNASVIMTQIDHMGVLIHKADGERYDLFVFSTFADALEHWIREAANDMKLVTS